MKNHEDQLAGMITIMVVGFAFVISFLLIF